MLAFHTQQGVTSGNTRSNRERGWRAYDASPKRTAVRFYDETKAAIKSTEFYAYLVTFAGILIAAQVISDGDSGTGASGDVFNANRAWLYLTILTVGYMVSRGLAKAGSAHREQDDGQRNSD